MAYTSFTITQPFLGAPLQFVPALGSAEFELLIDCYVTGSASKQDKLSQVTIDFYNTATVDLNTGALTKQYNVFPAWDAYAFEQSPTQSQSSGFSPPIYTPSPGSSATLGDSTYGSISLTPPTRTATSSGRVAKKAKKDTKKTAEARLPGFSIMTKDGIDVTTSAGRGTKTKEQREHAHLMRQLKACADCKRKKVRCDPSHRRSHNDMSRTSTSNASSSSRMNTSPAASTPSMQSAVSSFCTANTFDDFILFPDDMASWNPTDMAMTDFASQDLSQFNFDINDLDMNTFAPITPESDLNFSQSSFSMQQSSTRQSVSYSLQSPFSQQLSSLQLDSRQLSTRAPLQSDQPDLDSWAEPNGYSTDCISRTRPHPASPLNSGQLDSSWSSDLLRDGDGLSQNSFNHSPSSVSTSDLFADIAWSATSPSPRSPSQSQATSSSLNLATPDLNDGSQDLASDQNLVDSGILVDPSDQVLLTQGWVQPKHRTTRLGSNSFQEEVYNGHTDINSAARPGDTEQASHVLVAVNAQTSAAPSAPREDATAYDDGNFNAHVPRDVLHSEYNAPSVALSTQVQIQERVLDGHTATLPRAATQTPANILGSSRFTELQSGLNTSGRSLISTHQPQASIQQVQDPQSTHCLTRQDRLLDSEQAANVPVLVLAPNANANGNAHAHANVSTISAISSIIFMAFSTLLLSGLSLVMASGLFTFNLTTLQDTCFQWLGNDAWMLVVRLGMCATLLAFFPEIVQGVTWSAEQSSGISSFGLGQFAVAISSFFFGSGSYDGGLKSSTNAKPSPLKWQETGNMGFLIELVEHLSPVQTVV